MWSASSPVRGEPLCRSERRDGVDAPCVVTQQVNGAAIRSDAWAATPANFNRASRSVAVACPPPARRTTRRGRPLVRVAATAAVPQALEEDLLGGAATSERRKRPGRLFEADGGTLLIEEVGDLPAPTQALLFRLLEAREVAAPGGRTVPLDVRVIGTTSRPLTRAVEDGHFRDDLYFRLSALTLRLPPLKDRKEDIPALLDALAARHGGPVGGPVRRRSDERPPQLPLPGQRARTRERGAAPRGAGRRAAPVKLPDLDQKFSGEHVELALKESDDLKEIVEKVERQVIERVMRKVRGNQSLGARLLNISRGSLIAKMKQYDIKDFRYLKRQD